MPWEKENPSSHAYDQRQPEIARGAPPFLDLFTDFSLRLAILFIFGQPLS
jgi:hypothetical protein